MITPPTLTMRVYIYVYTPGGTWKPNFEWGVSMLLGMDINQLIMYDDKSVPKILYLAAPQ